MIGGRHYTVAIDTATPNNSANTLVKRNTDNSFASGKITVESGGVQVDANAATSTTAGNSNNWNTGYTLANAALARTGGTLTGGLFGTTASFSSDVSSGGGITATGSTSVGLSSINIGFNNGSGEIKAKSTSANPAATLTFYTTNTSNQTLPAMLITDNRDVSIGKDLAMNGQLSGVYSLSMYGDITGAHTVNASTKVVTPLVDTGMITGPSVMTIDPSGTGASGELIIQGSLTVKGTTTTIDSNTLSVGDSLIVLNGDESGTPSENAGIQIERGTSGNVNLMWVETGTTSTSYWAVTDASGVSPYTYPILHSQNFETAYSGNIEGGSF